MARLVRIGVKIRLPGGTDRPFRHDGYPGQARAQALGFGAIANVGIARMLYQQNTAWSVAGGIGAIIGAVWNYAVSSTLVWRAR